MAKTATTPPQKPKGKTRPQTNKPNKNTTIKEQPEKMPNKQGQHRGKKTNMSREPPQKEHNNKTSVEHNNTKHTKHGDEDNKKIKL